jgi:hypothetical protein
MLVAASGQVPEQRAVRLPRVRVSAQLFGFRRVRGLGAAMVCAPVFMVISLFGFRRVRGLVFITISVCIVITIRNEPSYYYLFINYWFNVRSALICIYHAILTVVYYCGVC